MPLDTSIQHWVNKVPSRQWQKEDQALLQMGSLLPASIVESRPLAEVHRLDLSLFVVFEEAALRISGALTRSAPNEEALNFSAQQTLDEARHREIFWHRLGDSCQALGQAQPEISDAIMIPPLRRFLERCYEVVDRGEFIEGLVLMNLIFEGMAYPLYAYEQRYWQPVDPYLAALVRSAFIDESRHVAYGAYIVNQLLQGDQAHQVKVRKLCQEASLAMGEVFTYYIHKFVKLFDTVARLHRDLFATTEFTKGRLIATTPYQEQIEIIQASITQQHSELLARAGLI